MDAHRILNRLMELQNKVNDRHELNYVLTELRHMAKQNIDVYIGLSYYDRKFSTKKSNLKKAITYSKQLLIDDIRTELV